MDRQYLKVYAELIQADFGGKCYTQATWHSWAHKSPAPHFGNSGAGAIALAARQGSELVILLGYDCKISGGRAHWHADHPKPLGNAGSVAKWPGFFLKAKDYAEQRHCKVLNASRETALTCFPRTSLHDALGA